MQRRLSGVVRRADIFVRLRHGAVLCAVLLTTSPPSAAWAQGLVYTQQGPRLTASDVTGPYASQGRGVALSADGNTALVGAPFDNPFWNGYATVQTGAGSIWTRAGSTWTQQGPRLVGTDSDQLTMGRQGYAVALSADGDTALIGGFTDTSLEKGAVFVWTRTNGVWTQQGPKLQAPDATGRNQGFSVAISPDGNTALIGAPNEGPAGAAWIWTRSGGVWTEGPKLVGTGYSLNSDQGYAVALSADGNTAMVTAPHDNSTTISPPGWPIGATWAYTRSGGVWSQQGPKLVGPPGETVSLSAEGNIALIGGTVWTRSGTTWSRGPQLVNAPYIRSTLSTDGSTALINATVWTRVDNTWTRHADLAVPSPWSVALSADGTTALVGDGSDNNSVGAARIFIQATPAIPGDVDGNGTPDLVWRNTASGVNVIWHLNGTSVTGQSSLPTVFDPAWRLIALADLNADGHPDAIWRNTTTGADVVWLLNGTSIVSQESLPSVPDLTWQLVAVADFSRDGWPDLIWRNQVTGVNRVWYMTGTTVASQVDLPSVSDLRWTLAAAADMNGDGAPDLLWRNAVSGANVVWYMDGVTVLNQGALPSVADPAWTLAAAMDLNSDGVAELFWRHRSAGVNVVWSVSGLTVTNQVVLPAVYDPTWKMIGPTPPQTSADIDGDQHPDLVWHNTTTGANLVWLLNGTSPVAQASLPDMLDLSWQRAGIGDFNGDGYPDLLWRHSVTGANLVWLLQGTTIINTVSLPILSDVTWNVAATADLDGDGQPDVVWHNSATGAIMVWYLNGTMVTHVSYLPTVPDPAWHISAAADVNGDGYADLFWRNTATGASIVWYLDGASGAVLGQAALPTVVDSTWETVAAVDLNSDNHPDLVWRNTMSGANVVWILNGTSLINQVGLPPVADTAWVLRQ